MVVIAVLLEPLRARLKRYLYGECARDPMSRQVVLCALIPKLLIPLAPVCAYRCGRGWSVRRPASRILSPDLRLASTADELVNLVLKHHYQTERGYFTIEMANFTSFR